MSAFVARKGLPVNTGQIDPRYNSTSRNYWTVACRDREDNVYLQFDHHGPTSVKEELKSRGISFDDYVDVTFHRE